jgi:FtsP/CotA-like multicopper oxidase with cupredoxin domain
MNKRLHLSRRDFFKIAGGAAAATAGACLLPGAAAPRTTAPIARADTIQNPSKALHLAATDGWIYLPGSVPIPGGGGSAFTPDPLAPGGRTTYIFGFRNVTGLASNLIAAQKGKAQASAPILWTDENVDTTIQLTNLGLSQRPDLVDSHTIHWHGFRNAIPLFDGVPEMSISVPIGRDFTYFYRPRDPGTYMYHCHFEDVEHVHMGMTGVVFVNPAMNSATQKYAYNDASTAYDRQFAIFLTDLWAEAHYDDAHIQTIDWTKFQPNYWLMNGRVYPDTLEPGSQANDTGTGDLILPTRPELQYQPISSLIKANEGDRVLLRIVSLGYQQYAMTLAGPPMRVVGKDARLLKGGGVASGNDNTFSTNVVEIGPGESTDAIFIAPAFSGGSGSSGQGYDTYLLYNREYAHTSNNDGSTGPGGQMTEIRVYPAGMLAAQTAPNT